MAERTHSVRLRLEVDQLRKDAQEASQAIGGIGSAAQDAGKQSTAMAKLGSAAAAFGKTAAAVGTVAAGSMIALGVSTFRTGVAYNTLEQTTRAALTTLLGSAEAAEQQMDKLREFVENRMFPREAFIQGQQMMLAFGFAAESVIPTLGAIEDAVLATGGSAQRFNEVVEILSRVQSTGQITAGTLNELGRRGINAAQLIGQAMGKTENEIRESITRGSLAGRDAIEILVGAMETRFAGAAEAVANTWVGATGLISAGLRNIGSTAAEAFIDPRGGGAAVVWARDIAEALYAFNGSLRPLVDELSMRAEPAFQRLSDRLGAFAAAIDRADFVGLFDTVARGAPVFAAFGAAVGVVGARGLPIIGALAGAINPLAAAIAAAALVSPELRQALFDLLDAFAPLLPIIADTATTLATALSTGLAAVGELLQAIIPIIAAVVDMFAALPGPVQQATLALGAFALALRFAGPVGKALVAIATLGAALEVVRGQAAATRVSVGDLTEALERAVTQGRLTGDIYRVFGNDLEKLHDILEVGRDVSRSYSRDQRETLKQVADAMAELVESGMDYQDVLDGMQDALGLTNAEMAEFRQAIIAGGPEVRENLIRALEGAADRAEDLAHEQSHLSDETREATAAMKEQADEALALADPMFALHKALRDVEDAQDAYNDAVEEYGPNSREAEQAALDFFAATLHLADAAHGAAGVFDGELTPAQRALLEAAGATEEQIRVVEEAFLGAADAGDKFAKDYRANVHVHTTFTQSGAAAGTEHIPARAGGFQHGGRVAGPAGVDRIPAWLTKDEHVWTVREVQAAGGHAQVEALRAAVLAGQTRTTVSSPVGVPAQRGLAMASSGGWTVNHMNVNAWSDRFSLRQVEGELAMHGAS